MLSKYSLHGMALLLACLVAAPLAAEDSPAEMVRAEVAEVLSIVKDASLEPAARRSLLTARIASSFDFDGMSQSILTVHWKAATNDQRERFKTLFTRLLEQVYVTAIERHTTEIVKVGGERYRGDTASVIVTIQREDRSDVPLLFKLKKLPAGGWIVYDANVEGLSLVRHYRDDFGAIAQGKGIDGVIAHLEAKTAT